MTGRPTPFDVICKALPPAPTREHQEERAHSVINRLTSRGYAITDLAAVERDQKVRADLVVALQGMLIEWDRLTRYGSPIAKAANERVSAARAALAKTGASV